jgi:molybdopterin/thiamine biosynthesis adenylyltransferase
MVDPTINAPLDLYSRERQSNAAFEKIKNRKVVIAGCGNVGSVLATILAESGIKHMILIDMDDFSYTDNRQLYSTESNMGKNKALATAQGVFERAQCYVMPMKGDAIDIIKRKTFDIKGFDLFLCVDSVDARKRIFDAAVETAGGRAALGMILDVGVQGNVIQVVNYKDKTPHNLYFDEGQAHCVTYPLASFRAFMAASLMAGAYFNSLEMEGKEDAPFLKNDRALQLFTNTMMNMENPIFQ